MKQCLHNGSTALIIAKSWVFSHTSRPQAW